MYNGKRNLFLNLVAITITLSPISVVAQKNDGYSLTGHINGLKDGDKVLMNMMVYNPGEAVEVHRDSAFVKNGEFHIEGHVPDGPRVYWMWLPRIDHVYRMFIDNNQAIQLRYDKDISKERMQLLDRILVSDGSPTNTAFHLIWAIDDMYSQSTGMIDHELQKIRDSIGYDRKLVDGLMRARKGIRQGLNNRFLNHLDPLFLPAAGLLAMYEGGDHDGGWADVYDQMDGHLRASVPGKMLQQRLPLLVGKKMPDFSLPDGQGKTVSLKDLPSKGKLTLVRFWATNSYNRAAFDAELKAMYQQYHNKGLNVVAVSTDTKLDTWKQTLQTEQYPWQNVIDLRGEAVVDTVYHELGSLAGPNTTNVLLDTEGNIVAWDVYGLELRWYLDTILNPEPAENR